MKSGNCSLSEKAIGSFNNNNGDLIYGGYCSNADGAHVNNSINIGLQTYRPKINRCRNSIAIGVDSGSNIISSSIQEPCGKGNGDGTGNISIGTRSGQYQFNPSIAIGYGVGGNQKNPQQKNSLSIQNNGLNSKISKNSLGLSAYNVPDLSENSIYLGTGYNRQYQIAKNAIVLSSKNIDQTNPNLPSMSIKQMGNDHEGFFVDTIRVNPKKKIPKDAVPLVYSPSTGEIYASDDCIKNYGQCGGKNYMGIKNCCEGLICNKKDDYYSQCLKDPN